MIAALGFALAFVMAVLWGRERSKRKDAEGSVTSVVEIKSERNRLRKALQMREDQCSVLLDQVEKLPPEAAQNFAIDGINRILRRRRPKSRITLPPVPGD